MGIISYASVFIYYPLEMTISQVSPPITLYVINTAGENGANHTSAVVNITASRSEQSLITNPGFDTGADSWYYTTNDGKLSAAWISSDGIASGLILIYNATDVSQISDSILYLYQNFTVPETVSTVNYEITYRLHSEPSIYVTYLYLGVYDWESGTMTWFINGQSVSPSSSYTTDSGSATITLTPGKTYAIVVGVELYQYIYWSASNFYFLIDSVNLTYTPSVERFNNDILGIKTDGNYTIKYVITGITGGDNITCNLTLHTDYGSDTITIINGTPNKNETRWITIRYGGNTLYYDGRLTADVEVSTTGARMTIEGKIVYAPEGGGVIVEYPVEINIEG